MNLAQRKTAGANILNLPQGRVRLEIPAGASGEYRLAQLDDYAKLPRSRLAWHAPLQLSLRARVSGASLPGTWGFGWWNDPFAMGLGLGGMARRLPTLPNTAWFFYAGAGNHLAFRDDHPASGVLAATFSANAIVGKLLPLAAVAAPLLLWKPTARLLRRLARLFLRESAAAAEINPTEWHEYGIDWQVERVVFFIDGRQIATSNVSPSSPLGMVIWIDNQYAAFRPDGSLQMGFSENQPAAWLEIENMQCT